MRPPLSLVVSLLLSLVSTLVLSQTGGVLSHLNFLTYRFLRFPLRNLCSLVMLAVSSLSSLLQRTQPSFRFLSLRLAELRILPAAPVDTRPRTPLISFCTVQLRTLCAAYSLATVYLSTTSGPDPGELLGFWGSMVFCHVPIPRKGSGKQQQQHGVIFQSDHFVLSTNFLFKFNVSLPLVTGELLQNTVDVNDYYVMPAIFNMA